MSTLYMKRLKINWRINVKELNPQKLVRKLEAAERNLIDKRVPDVQDREADALLNSRAVA